MREQIASKSIQVPEFHPPVEIELTLLLRLEKRVGESLSVGIHMSPALLPEHLSDELFFKGICNGALAAMAEIDVEPFNVDVEIDVRDLAISRGFDDLTDDATARSPIHFPSRYESNRSILPKPCRTTRRSCYTGNLNRAGGITESMGTRVERLQAVL